MPTDHRKALAAEKSEDVCAAIERCTVALRRGEVRDLDLVAVCDQLVKLAAHDDRLVRRAVAGAAQHLPDPYFERIIAPLAKDKNSWVKAAAERSIKARSATRLTERRREQVSVDARELFDEIEKKYKREARRLAERARDRSLESFVRRVRHEFAKAGGSLREAIDRIGVAADARVIDRAKVKEDARQALAVYQLLLDIVDSAQNITHVPTAHYASENILGVVEQAQQHLLDRAGERKSRLRVEVDVDETIALEIDRSLLVQAFSNVLENSVEAYPADAAELRIRVHAKVVNAGTQVELAFQDWGVGISESSLPFAGEPYRSSKGGYMRGLGLANVKKMVESAHGGRVIIEGKAGVGTTVRMVLPRRQKKAS